MQKLSKSIVIFMTISLLAGFYGSPCRYRFIVPSRYSMGTCSSHRSYI